MSDNDYAKFVARVNTLPVNSWNAKWDGVLLSYLDILLGCDYKFPDMSLLRKALTYCFQTVMNSYGYNKVNHGNADKIPNIVRNIIDNYEGKLSNKTMGAVVTLIQGGGITYLASKSKISGTMLAAVLEAPGSGYYYKKHLDG